MSKLGTNASVRPTISYEGVLPPGEKLLREFNEMRDELVSTLWFLLGNHQDAQDAAQEAFLKCWRAQDSLKEIRNLRAWIFRIGLNVARDCQRSAWYRRSKQLANDDMHAAGSNCDPERAVEDQETQDRLRQAILHLRQDEKEVFLLRQNGDLTFEQIAELRRTPLGTVKTQMRSALHKLRQKLAP